MDIEEYFRRIKYTGPRTVTFETLKAILQAIYLNIPYSNTSVTSGRVLKTNPEAIYENIVKNQQGGICVEINFLFTQCLRQLDFKVRNGHGKFYYGGKFTVPYHHLTPIVTLNDEEWYVDAGWKFFEPVKMEMNVPQVQSRGVYRMRKAEEDNWFYFERLRKSVVDTEGKVLKQGPYEGEWKVSKLLTDDKLITAVDYNIWRPICAFTTEHQELNNFHHMFDVWTNDSFSLLQQVLFHNIFTDVGMIQVESNIFTRKEHMNPVVDRILEVKVLSTDEEAEELINKEFKMKLDYKLKYFTNHKF